MTARSTGRHLACAVIAFALLTAGAPAGASVRAQEAPTVVVETLPAYPDGANGWFVTEPAVYATVSEDAQLRWGWDSLTATATVSAGVQRYIADGPEGEHSFTYDAIGATGHMPGSVMLKTDATLPTSPADFTASGFPGPGVTLAWGASTDAISGVVGYEIYRDADGAPYTYGDHIATTTSTSYQEEGSVSVWRNAGGMVTLTWEPATSAYRYAVRAVDEAGNESLLTEAMLLGGAYDEIAVLRSEDGSPYSTVATLPVDATSFTDPDAVGETVLYMLQGLEADGGVLAQSVPAPVVDDLIAPPAPTPLLTPVYSATGPAAFRLTWPSWTPITDAGSGVSSAVLAYGPQEAPTETSELGSARTLAAAGRTALWAARVRTEDRAGNVALSGIAVARNVATSRISGADRVATSRAVAAAAFTHAKTAVFASSLDFPDALAASALAGAVEGPVVLVGRGVLPAETRYALASLGVTDAYVIGGTGAIEPATCASIDAALPGPVTRVAGRDRYDTAAAVARKVAALSGRPPRAFVVSGRVFADALSVGPAAYVLRAPVLFADPDRLPDATTKAVASLGIPATTIVGGSASVTSAADRMLPQAGRLAGKDRYATSSAFASWAVATGTLGADAPVLATGAAFPDGLSAAPLAGTSASPVLLTHDAYPAEATVWLQLRRAALGEVRIVGGTSALSDALRVRAWSAVSRP